MDKSCHSSGESTAATSSNTTSSNNTNTNTSRGDQYLRHLNKLSHRISKPILRINPFDHTLLHPQRPPHPSSSESPSLNQQQHQVSLDPPPHQHQPPVYNINKSDFRDVVQKLTGSPAHDRLSIPQPPIQPPKPSTSRLHRIRPPPLAAVAVNPNINDFRQPAPLSPLPPFPSVHGAMESPISAYMRYFQSSIRASVTDYDPKQPSRLQIHPPPSLQNHISTPNLSENPSSSSIAPLMPASFVCFPSPRSMFLSGQLALPTSPGLPAASPRWRDVE